MLVYNQKSGSALSVHDLRQLFNDAKIEVIEAITITPRLKMHLKDHIRDGATIATVGGDGTVSAVAGLLAGTDATLLPLPGGTLNHFTQDLGIDQDLKVAIQKAVTAKRTVIDLASVNDRYFINNSSIGLYPSSLHERSRFESMVGKWPAAVLAALRSFVRFRTYKVKIDKKEFRTPFVFVGNNGYDIDKGLGSRNALNKGILSVFTVRTNSRFELLKIAGMAVVGRASHHKRFDSLDTKRITIQSRHRVLKVSCDGELLRMNTPLEYVLHAKKLHVLR